MPLNPAIFASAFHPHLGGVEELCRQLALEYRRRGLDAIVITNRWPRDLPSHEIFEGIPLYRLAMRVPEGNFRVRFNYRLSHAFIKRDMFSILRRHKINMLHVQCVSCNGYYASIAQHAMNLPLVVSAQGERTMDAAGIYQHSPFQNQVLRNLVKDAGYITACSQNTLDDIQTWYGHSIAGRAKPIYNGIHLAEFNNTTPPRTFAHPRPYFLAIGRHVPQKGFDILLRAFAQSQIESHDLLLAGDGPEHEPLKKLATELNLQNKVRFTGRADRPTAVSLFHGCDCFILPSRMEPQGIVNLEAMAASKPVIASNTGGVPEIVQNNQTGILVPPENIEALSTAMKSLANNPNLRQQLGQAGRQRAESFDWQKIADQYLAIYHQIVQPQKIPHKTTAVAAL